MKKAILVVAALLWAGTASAQGINLAWNDCGLNGLSTTTFTCDTNSGAPLALIASFVPPAGLSEFLGISAEIDITVGTQLPDWWKHGNGLCRGTTGLATSFDFTSGPFSCTDFYGGQAAGGFAYDAEFGTASRARFRIQCAVPIDNRGPIDAGTEYYCFKANLLKSKTTGAGSCAGCLEEACIVLNSVQLFQPPDKNFDPEIIQQDHSNFVTYQSASIANCPTSTAARNSTWGQVKSLYR